MIIAAARASFPGTAARDSLAFIKFYSVFKVKYVTLSFASVTVNVIEKSLAKTMRLGAPSSLTPEKGAEEGGRDAS